jgi:hypothetical protein
MTGTGFNWVGGIRNRGGGDEGHQRRGGAQGGDKGLVLR